MAATNPLVDFLQDSLDLSRVNAPEIWELVAALVEHFVYNIVPCRSEPYSSGLILLGRQRPCGEVHHYWIHLSWPYVYGVYVHSLGWAKAGLGEVLNSDSLEVRF